MTKLVKIRMLRMDIGASNGIENVQYNAGSEPTVSEELAVEFVKSGSAQILEDAPPAPEPVAARPAPVLVPPAPAPAPAAAPAAKPAPAKAAKQPRAPRDLSGSGDKSKTGD